MDQKLLNKLNKRFEEGTLRSLSHFEGFSDFYSNDYFGFSKLKTESDVHTFGSTGSRLISGNSSEALTCEKFLADFFTAEAAIVFNSGYDANLGLFSSIPQRGDTILYDESIHASIRDGIRLSNAHSYSFRHNDTEDLSLKLSRSKGTVYVAVEGLYSMEGDIAPLELIAELAQEFHAYLIVDEAHSAGVFGRKGKGLVEELGLGSKVFARLVTFGKSYGSHGAAIFGEKALIDYLVNFSRSFIYTTALPPYEYNRIKCVVDSENIDRCQLELQQKIKYFRGGLCSFSPLSNESSPIQMLRVGDIDRTRLISQVINDNKIAVKPIYSPSVKTGSEGVRICLHAFNSVEEIDKLLKVLNDF